MSKTRINLATVPEITSEFDFIVVGGIYIKHVVQ